MQGTKEWFDLRKSRVTASKVGAILNIAPYGNRASVLDDMINPKESKSNTALDYGIFHENLAKVDFCLKTGLEIKDADFVISEKYNWLGASPDGYVSDGKLIEIKCPYSLKDGGDFKTLEEQPYYYAQVQIQLYCTGYKEAYFYQWSPFGDSLEVVEYNQKYIDDILPKLEDFYNDYLRAINIDDLILQYANNKKAIDELKNKQDNLLAEMVALTCENGYKSDLGTLYKTVRSGSIAYAKIVKEHLPDLDLEPYKGESSQSWTLKIKGEK